MYALVVHRRAARYLGMLSQDQQAKIKQVLNEMRNDPWQFLGSSPWPVIGPATTGCASAVIFWIDKDRHLISVDYIGPRGDVYKGGA